MSAAKHEVLGIGAPILDHLIRIQPQYLDTLSGEKFGMETVSYSEIVRIIENSGSVPKQVAGGSCANAVKGLAALGRKCALIGKIGNDPIGEKLIETLQDLGVTPLLNYSSKPTAHVACLITPDGRRTCRSFLGACQEMGPADLDPSHFHGVKLVHVEGYSLLCEGLTEKAMHLAKEAGALVSFDCGSFEMARNFKSDMLALIEAYVDILFANERENESLTGKPPEQGCSQLQSLCKAAVVMLGRKGCFAAAENKCIHVPTHAVEPVDTTGAGDLFASGFLHGYLAGNPLEECARWGTITGAAAVLEVGAEIPAHKWPAIRHQLGS